MAHSHFRQALQTFQTPLQILQTSLQIFQPTMQLFRRTLPASLGALAIAAPLMIAVACGGSNQETNTAADANSEPSTDNLGTYPDSGETEEVDMGCDDGTCFTCGEGLCPKGAYCDQDAQGGGACAWLSECPASPSCSCLTKVLGSTCNCDESDGGPLVSCQ